MFRRRQLTFPVTVQPASDQSGIGRIRIEHPLDWQRAFNSNRGGRMPVMVQTSPEETDRSRMVHMVIVGKSGTMEPFASQTMDCRSYDLPDD